LQKACWWENKKKIYVQAVKSRESKKEFTVMQNDECVMERASGTYVCLELLMHNVFS